MKKPRERQTVAKTSAVSRGIFLPETCPGLLCLFRNCLRHKTGIPLFSTLFFLYFSKVFTSPFTFAKYSSASFSSPALPLVPSMITFLLKCFNKNSFMYWISGRISSVVLISPMTSYTKWTIYIYFCII